jgi:hypothetical protein
VIVGAIIAGKFIYRWYTTKQLAKESQERKRNANTKKDKKNLTLGNIVVIINTS